MTLRTWLANGIEKGVTGLIENSDELAGAIYHLADRFWVIPACREAGDKDPERRRLDVVIKKDKDGNPNTLDRRSRHDRARSKADFHPRNKTNIMHNKFLVAGRRLNHVAQGCRRG